MYRSGLVPRRMTWVGMIGAPLLFLANVGALFDWWDAGSTVPALATIPEFIWELFLGVYCTIWGFRKDAPILAEGSEVTSRRPSCESGMTSQTVAASRAGDAAGRSHGRSGS